MFKKISVEQLRPGMHIKEFCGSWMEHPFLRTGFVIKNQKEIDKILASSIREVWIDSGKGVDVPADTPSASVEQVEAQVELRLAQASKSTRVAQPAVSFSEEVERAAQICVRSKQAVVSMFEEARMGNAVNVASAQQLVEEISDSVLRNTSALISLARLKTADDYTYMHSVAVCAMMIALGKQLGLGEEQTRAAGMAGLLHDLGKAAMPMEILNKPGSLTDAEFSIIKSHPVKGHRMLQDVSDVDDVALDVCLHHHEKIDGSGYPKGLRGDQISLFARMGAVCDVYDAITSNRPYKTGWDPAESLRKMASWSTGHFDTTVFQAFVKSLGIYPVGSLVRLISGRIGVVVDQTQKSLTTPRVKVFYSVKSNLRIPPEVIDLSAHGCADKILQREDPLQWRFPDLNDLWIGAGVAPA